MSGESKSQMPMVSSSRHLAAEERRTVESPSVRDVGERIDGAELRRIRQESGQQAVADTRAAKRHNARVRRRRLAAGEAIWGDLDAVREHLNSLRQFGMGTAQIAAHAQVGQATIARMRWRFKGVGRAERVTAEVAARILSVRPDVRKLTPGTIVDSTGVRRRIQALIVAGSGTRCWTIQILADRVGMDRQQFLKYTWRPRYSAGICVRLLDLFAELWPLEPPEVSQSSASRTLNMARRKGWVGLGAWDDDTIDDPNAVPDLQGDGEPVIDDVKVTIVLEGRGRFRTLNWPERADLARRWLERGGSKTAFETMFGVSSQTSAKCFSRIGTDRERKTA